VQSFILTEVSDCGLLIVVTFFFFGVFCLCVCVCVYLCMHLRAYLAIPCVSANDHVKHTNQILNMT